MPVENGANMGMRFSDAKEFQQIDLQELFLSVEWVAGHYPGKLVVAMENSDTVFSAWDNDKLVGLVNALDDGIMTAYIHFLLVRPDYQGRGVGKELLKMLADKYREYMRIVLIADDQETVYYQNSGFKLAKGTKAMFIEKRFVENNKES